MPTEKSIIGAIQQQQLVNALHVPADKWEF
jgi:hypothetical protein